MILQAEESLRAEQAVLVRLVWPDDGVQPADVPAHPGGVAALVVVREHVSGTQLQERREVGVVRPDVVGCRDEVPEDLAELICPRERIRDGVEGRPDRVGERGVPAGRKARVQHGEGGVAAQGGEIATDRGPRRPAHDGVRMQEVRPRFGMPIEVLIEHVAWRAPRIQVLARLLVIDRQERQALVLQGRCDGSLGQPIQLQEVARPVRTTELLVACDEVGMGRERLTVELILVDLLDEPSGDDESLNGLVFHRVEPGQVRRERNDHRLVQDLADGLRRPEARGQHIRGRAGNLGGRGHDVPRWDALRQLLTAATPGRPVRTSLDGTYRARQPGLS